MAEYREYISALRKCAKEHENDNISFANIRTSDLCNDTADLLERLENGINKAIEDMANLEESCTNMVTDEKTLANACYEQYAELIDECIEILKRNTGE